MTDSRMYRKRPVAVRAEQWWPGMDVEGVEVSPPRVIWSQDGQFFYLEVPGRRPTHWMEREKTPGPVPEEKKSARFEGFIEVRPTNPPEGLPPVYYRKVLDFRWFNIKSVRLPYEGNIALPYRPETDEDLPPGLTMDMVLDYASHEKWPASSHDVPDLTPQQGIVHTHQGPVPIQPGAYVIREPDGNGHYPCDRETFEATYEELPGDAVEGEVYAGDINEEEHP